MNIESGTTSEPETRTSKLETRRYDIDWIRVIAIGLLIIYHAAVAFQPWGPMIGFVTNKNSWTSLWLPMAVLNVWRIPLLFFVSGMGVYFAMRSRTWKDLIGERAKRIFIPYLFGMLVIVPIQVAIWREKFVYYGFNPAHLWFLGNIMTYVVIFSPVFYFVKIKKFSPLIGILLFMIAMVAEVLVIKPYPYELYAMTLHGFFLGMIAFFFGYLFASQEIRMLWIGVIAIGLTIFRLAVHSYTWLIPVESVSWIVLILSLGNRFLNKPGRVLKYLSEAAYPVYIVHMIFQFLGSILIFKLDLPVQLQFVMLVIFTLGGCLLTYEIIKRTKVTRFLFGLKTTTKPVQP